MSSVETVGFKRTAWAFIVCLVAAQGKTLATETQFPVAQTKAFLELNCYDCHDEGTRKGGMRIDNLPLNLADAAAAEKWGRILSRLEAGEMPPPDQDPPPRAEVEAVMTSVKHALAAEAKMRRTDGRARIRRLNRREYENTVRDLLGIDVALRGLLPADDRADGFDTASKALHISPVHIQRYLDAANLALETALMRGPKPAASLHRFSYDSEQEERFFAQKAYGRMMVCREGELQFYAEPGIEHPAFLRQFSELTRKQPGRYRVRVAARTLDAQGQSVVFGLRTAGPNQRLGIESLGWFDAPPETATGFEVEAVFAPGDTIIVEPYRLNDMRRQRGFSQYAPGDDPIIARRTVLKNPQPPTGLALGIPWVEVEGPIVETWPPLGHQRLFGNLKGVSLADLPTEIVTPGVSEQMRKSSQLTPVSAQPEADAAHLLRSFMPRAFRRPVTDDEIEPYLGLVTAAIERSESFESAMLAAYRAVLCSPDFLFLVEEPGLLSNHALAARLAYFLWRTAPDDRLRSAADRGDLHRTDVLRREVDRLLDSPRSATFIRDFLDHWLHLREIDATMPDRELFPEFYVVDGGKNFKEDGLLHASLLDETRRFFSDLLENDSSLLQLIDSDFTYLNSRLAAYYRLPPVTGAALRRISLPPGSVRGGVLTHGSVLKVTANGSHTSPVVRGVWFLENMLDRRPPPPPPDAGSIDPDTRGTTTIREQLAKHQRSASCAACHRVIDPPGFALENFDPAGQWRDAYRVLPGPGASTPPQLQAPAFAGENLRGRDILGPMTFVDGAKVDASGELPNGQAFTGVKDFKRKIANQPDAVARALASKLLTFSTGQHTEPGDRLEIDAIVARARERQYGLRTLLHAVVQSELFRHK